MTTMGTATTGSRREQIVAAAAELFARRGFHGVGIDDIGAAVGISGPALYRHFRSKDAVLGQMLLDISEKLLTGGRQRVAAVEDPAQALRTLVRWQVDFALAQPALITVQTRDLANLSETDQRQVRRLQRSYVEVWVAAIQQAVPGTSEDTARAAAHAVFGLINSTPHSALPNRTETAALLERLALAALLACGG